MFKNHNIERLKLKISEIEAKSLETEARLRAESEARLKDQKRTIENNAFLLQSLIQAQHATYKCTPDWNIKPAP
jgi:hypothetical protein